MMTRRQELSVEDAVVRPFEDGDETEIVSLLNLCFGEWGTIQQWRKSYLQHPNFEKNDIFVIEKDDEIIGYEGLQFRDLLMQRNRSVRTISLRDAAIHPRYRRRGLHARLLEMMLQAARSKGAGLVFSWYLRGSSLHNHARSRGFVEVKQNPAYMKIIRPEKVLKSGLLDFLHKSQSLSRTLDNLDSDLRFRIGETSFSTNELLGKTGERSDRDGRAVEVIFTKDSLSTIAKFRSMTKHQRLKCLISLILMRRVKISFNSFRALVDLAQKGLSVIGSL